MWLAGKSACPSVLVKLTVPVYPVGQVALPPPKQDDEDEDDSASFGGAGDSRLARIAALVQYGDWLSFYLALLNGSDPTPIASIDAFKARLAEWGARRS